MSRYMQVTAIDQDTEALCSSVNDPHMSTYDRKRYNNFFQGEFVLHRSRKFPTAVSYK